MRQLIPISQIETTFDVRKQAGGHDEDRVEHLSAFYEAGRELPPIIVVPMGDNLYWLEEGRTRLAALKQLGHTEVLAEVLPAGKEKAKSITDAYFANTRGPKPPTFADLVLTLELLLGEGWSTKRIREEFVAEAPSRLEKALHVSSSTVFKHKVAAAKNLIADGLTVEQAAAKSGIDPDLLSNDIRGKSKRPEHWLSKQLAAMTNAYRQRVTANKQWMDKTHTVFEEGVPLKDLVKAYETQIKRLEQQKSHFTDGLLRLQRRAKALSSPKGTFTMNFSQPETEKEAIAV